MDNIRPGFRSLVTLFLSALLVVASATASARSQSSELDDSWQQYLNSSDSLQPAFRFPHASCFRAAALQTGLPESLLLAVARGESDFDASARSKANAHGVMQIQCPGTARHLGIHRLSDLYDPCLNIDAGARYLQQLINDFDGNLHRALAAYNYGPGRIANSGAMLPSGAVWYSGYIYRHLNFILGSNTPVRPLGDALYSDIGQSTLLTFGEPYRAEAFIHRLEQRTPDLNLDWFRRGTGEFEVVMTYADREEFDRNARHLAASGFHLD